MYITKELSLLEGVKIHTVGHLRVRLLEVSENEIYLLPEAIGIYETGGYLVMRSSGKSDFYISSSNVHTIEGLVRLFKEHLVTCENYLKGNIDYFGLPIISATTYLDPFKEVSGYFSVEEYSSPFKNLKEALKSIESKIVPALMRTKFEEKELTEEQIQDRIYFGSFLTELFDKYHFEFLAAHLDISPTNLRSMRASGSINYKHAVRLKPFSDCNSEEFFKHLLRSNEYSLERMTNNSDINTAKVAYELRTFRLLKGVSIFELYKSTGLKEASLSRYETAKVKMSPDVFYTIFEALDDVKAGSVRDSRMLSEKRNRLLSLFTKEFM